VPEFIDIVHAKAREGSEEEMISRRPALEAGVKEKLPGLLEIRLIRLDDGTYIDLLRWESREAADAAVEKFADIPEAGEIHSFLSGGDLAHHRGEIVGTR
jgi:heme-degrading monooxygenase HmoA